MELLMIHPGGRHGHVEPSMIDLPSGSVPGAASESPRIRFRGGGDVGSCFWKISVAPTILGLKGFYRRRRGPRRRPRGRGGSHPRVQVGPRPAAAPGPWVACQVALWSSSSFCRIKNRRKLLSNSENIFRSNFSEIENSKNRELAYN